MALDELTRRRLGLLSHLFADLLARHFDFLIGKKPRISLDLSGEYFCLTNKIGPFSLALLSKRCVHGLALLIEASQPLSVISNDRLGLLFLRRSFLEASEDFVAARLEKITDERQGVTDDDERENKKVPEREPDLINRGRVVFSLCGGRPGARSADKLKKTQATFLPRIFLTISWATLLASSTASCRSLCNWLSTSRRTPSSIAIASS